MIYYIKGNITGTFAGGVIIENNGIGYKLSVPASSALCMASRGDTVTAYTYMAVREDDISLYGFDEEDGLQVFMLLTTVSGVGAKAALAILSALSVDEIKRAVASEQPEILARAQGVGKKTAQRIVIDLRDKFKDYEYSSGDSRETADSASMQSAAEAVEALVSLGYSRSEASEAVKEAGAQADDSAESYLKAALKKLSRL